MVKKFRDPCFISNHSAQATEKTTSDTNFFKWMTNVITFCSGAKFLKMENNKKY